MLMNPHVGIHNESEIQNHLGDMDPMRNYDDNNVPERAL